YPCLRLFGTRHSLLRVTQRSNGIVLSPPDLYGVCGYSSALNLQKLTFNGLFEIVMLLRLTRA
ncbi:MAG: hypothetical protein LBT81_02805, partial [Helicobacteraceae bacterium]|nr:hypothetical protein [Helicobacteraceae bacterium]